MIVWLFLNTKNTWLSFHFSHTMMQFSNYLSSAHFFHKPVPTTPIFYVASRHLFHMSPSLFFYASLKHSFHLQQPYNFSNTPTQVFPFTSYSFHTTTPHIYFSYDNTTHFFIRQHHTFFIQIFLMPLPPSWWKSGLGIRFWHVRLVVRSPADS